MYPLYTRQETGPISWLDVRQEFPSLAAQRLMDARSRARLTEAQGKVCSGTNCKTLKLLLNKAVHVASGLTCNFFGKHHERCCQTVMGIAVVRSQAWQLSVSTILESNPSL